MILIVHREAISHYVRTLSTSFAYPAITLSGIHPAKPLAQVLLTPRECLSTRFAYPAITFSAIPARPFPSENK